MKRGAESLEKRSIHSIMESWPSKKRLEFVEEILRERRQLTSFLTESAFKYGNAPINNACPRQHVIHQLLKTVRECSYSGDFELAHIIHSNVWKHPEISEHPLMYIRLCFEYRNNMSNQYRISLYGKYMTIEHELLQHRTAQVLSECHEVELPKKLVESVISMDDVETYEDYQKHVVPLFEWIWPRIYEDCKKYGQANILADFEKEILGEAGPENE